MLKNKSQKTILSGMLLAIGILLPLVTAHGFGIPGTIFLPMHLPVLFCGLLAGPLYGGILGFILPLLNCFLTGMPILFPTAVMMTFELCTYGLVSGLINRLPRPKNLFARLYIALVAAMVAGRVVSGLVAAALLSFNPALKIASVIASTLTGLPGIAVQLILIPALVRALSHWIGVDIRSKAEKMVNTDDFNCVVIKGRKIIAAENCRGISTIMRLHQENRLKGCFVADDVVGKAAAMIFTAGGVKSCYAKVISRPALAWLTEHKVAVRYETLTDNIINRKGDGLCPMESAVLEICDNETAVAVLLEKIKELAAKTQ